MREELIVHGVEWGADRVSVSLTFGDKEHRLRFAASEKIGRETDFVLPTTVLPAMMTGVRLELPGEVSPRLLSAVPKIQDVFCSWDGEKFRRVPVEAGVRDVGVKDHASGVACFFSGGVDSFYTLLKRQEEITHLIFMELHRQGPSVRGQASRAVREVAKDLGKTLIEVETNLSQFSTEARIGWHYFHGMRLASVGLLFQHLFRKVLIPATLSYDNLTPAGSHPLLDPLWSTESMDFEHDGAEATRVEKVAYISEHEIAMRLLRVCFMDPDAYNCGRCRKCLLTMLNLRAAGSLGRCKPFPDDLEPEAVATMDLSTETTMVMARENLQALKRLV